MKGFGTIDITAKGGGEIKGKREMEKERKKKAERELEMRKVRVLEM